MDDTDEIKNRIDIVELMSSYLTLKKAGANYRALCPFHNEKTPSLMISPEKQIFKCFGCNEGGDIFSFIMKMENLEFREALEMLAARAGVKLKKFRIQNAELGKAEAPDKKTRLFRLNSLCAQVYHKILTAHPSGKVALDYLKKRGLNDQTIKDFMIGYSPSSRAVKSFLLKKGFTEPEIQNAGGPDRFYRRIIFPITDVMGNVLGFTGRTIDKDQQPKYLNTPETIIFHKGRILYNLTRARGDIKLEKNTVVVEGQMDVISSYQAGVKNVVATSGTALTPDHLQILYRYTPNITFAFDSDSAGLATAKKAFEMAIEQGFNVKMTELGKFKDPGEMIEKDAKLWVETVKKAKPVIEWYFTLAFGKQLPNSNSQFSNELTSQQKKEIAREILPIINKIPDTIEQADYLGKLAKKLDLGEEVIFDALNRQKDKKTNRQRDNQINRESDNKERNKISPEEILIGIIVKNPDLLKIAVSKIKTEDFEGFPEKVYKISKNWYTKKEEGVLIKTLKKELSSEKFAKLEILLLEIEEKYSDNLTDTFTDLVTKIAADKKEIIKEKYAKEISLAEKSGDRSKLKKLIQEFQDAIK